MGSRGPVPERSENLLGHRTKAQLDGVTKLPAQGSVRAPAARAHWHKYVKDLYNSMKRSAQAVYFEASDWAYLTFTCEEINDYYAVDDEGRTRNRTAMRLQVINQMLTQCLMTEAERRRVQIEIDRGPTEDPLEAAAAVAYADLDL